MTVSDSTAAPVIRAVQAKAARSSFYAAMRLMPKSEREAMFAIYAFCRRVDDIADDGIGTRAQRHEALEEWRADLTALYAGGPSRLSNFLKVAVEQFKLRKEDFFSVIDGMDMDVAENIFAPSLATLDLYCDRVASAVGRLSVRVFGMEEESGKALAHHLGRALQLTNILRDLDEDAGMGRLYLPREYLKDAGLTTGDPAHLIHDPKIDQVCRATAALAHEHYRKASEVLGARPKGRLRTPKLMEAVYCEILKRMEKQGWAPPRHRVSLSKSQLMMIMLRNRLSG